MLNLRNRLLCFLLRHLYNAITDDSFLKIVFDNKKSGIMKGGELLPDGQVQEYAAEARSLIKMPVYVAVIDSMRAAANKQIVQEGDTIDKVNFGRACLYTVKVIDEKLKNIAKL